MRTPSYSGKKARSATGWAKHPRPIAKRMANNSERKGARQELVLDPKAERSPLSSRFSKMRYIGNASERFT
jgi:hypothetical protein